MTDEGPVRKLTEIHACLPDNVTHKQRSHKSAACSSHLRPSRRLLRASLVLISVGFCEALIL